MDFDPDTCLEKIMSMLDINSNLQDPGPETSNLQDSCCDEDEDGDLESLSDYSIDDEGEGQGEELRQLMELMDEELVGTAVGRSFERESTVSCCVLNETCLQ